MDRINFPVLRIIWPNPSAIRLSITVIPIFLLWLTITACEKEPCIPPELSENVVGSWEYRNNQVIFYANGDFRDVHGLFDRTGQGGRLIEFSSYTVSENTITLMHGGISFEPPLSLRVDFNECNRIRVSNNNHIPGPYTLTRQ